MQAHRELPNLEGKLWNELLVVQDQVVQGNKLDTTAEEQKTWPVQRA